MHLQISFKVVDAGIDARPGNSSLGLPASSFDTSIDTAKPVGWALPTNYLPSSSSVGLPKLSPAGSIDYTLLTLYRVF